MLKAPGQLSTMERHGIQFFILWLTVCISVGYARVPKKIIGGMNALDGEFPYQVSIHHFNKHWCGGSILDSTHILTAAHCVISDKKEFSRPEDLQVITGTIRNNDLRNDNVFQVSQIISHEYYTPQRHQSTGVGFYADIAVLKLATPIPFNVTQMPIELPNSATPPGAQVVSIGWGVTAIDENGVQTRITRLQKLQMTTVSLIQCQVHYGQLVNVGHICAIFAHGSGPCSDDSGGPLIYNNKVVGIVSWALKCADERPLVFTNVYDYRDWIKRAMQS